VTALLEVEQLEVVYQRVITAVQGVSLSVGAGEIVALLGPNGAGKSTALRAISGFLDADDARITEGHVRFRGEAVTRAAPHTQARRGLVLIPEREKVFESLTVRENLEAARRGRPGARAPVTLEQVLGYFPVLADRRRQLAGYLSGGERQMLAVASALLCQPLVLLVDELSLGLAPLVVKRLVPTLSAVAAAGVGVLLIEQFAHVALGLANRAYILEGGRIRYSGTAQELKDRPELLHSAYLLRV